MISAMRGVDGVLARDDQDAADDHGRGQQVEKERRRDRRIRAWKRSVDSWAPRSLQLCPEFGAHSDDGGQDQQRQAGRAAALSILLS